MYSHDHLPNAKHIDNIFKSIELYTDIWKIVHQEIMNNGKRSSELSDAWEKNMNAIAYQDNPEWSGWLSIHEKRCLISMTKKIYVCEYPLFALVIFDCAHMINSELNDIELLSKLGADAATLMYPLVLAQTKIRELK